MRILVVNAGSSSLKLSIVGDDEEREDAVELSRGSDASRERRDDHAELREALGRLTADGVAAVGHRVVHGGGRHAPALVSDELLEEIDGLDALAPLHNRVAADAIRRVQDLLPDVPHVACFDTAFHAGLPLVARTYALPDAWVDRLGIRRHGFHGLSVRWAVERAADLLGRDASELGLVVAHLGSGASVTAVEDGRSVATSMGMTPLEGLVMGTRSGSVDPGILLALLRDGVDVDELEDGIAHRSGLVALSRDTSDVRALEARAATGDERARLALDVFAARAAAEIAAAATALRRLDALVFTGGIGWHAARVRAAICERLSTLRVPLADGAEDAGPDAADRVLVPPAEHRPALIAVRAREDLVIARDVRAFVTNRPT
ncbi:MAG TPA: acetate/propionate family kinase [Candidatus Limnocylindria bacterium]